MRLRSFSGRTMNEAMSLVRQHLGADAIIVSTQEDEDGLMSVTAALEADLAPYAVTAGPSAVDAIATALDRHGCAPDLAEKIIAAALPYDEEEPLVALSSALATLYPFKPVAAEDGRRCFFLAGPPGAGKTVTAAKLAARTVFAGKRVRLITADAQRAGAAEQLASFAKILKVPMERAEDAAQLAAAVAAAQPAELVIVDGPGINPYEAAERSDWKALAAAAKAEALLVLPAGGDVVDTLDMARIFAADGCTRLIVTRLDLSRRFGSVIAVADELRLPFAEAGVSSAIADGLSPFNPVLLGRLLLAEEVRSRRPAFHKRGVS
jgi:flagellar biosynthesis protein FlhF